MRTDMSRRGLSLGRCSLLCLAILVVLAGSVVCLGQDQESIATLRRLGKAFASIAEKASPAVVSIKAEKTITQQYSGYDEWPFGEPWDPFSEDFFDFFFRRRIPRQRPRQRQYRTTAQGSGFIITPDGYILTNNHVVGQADAVEVELLDGRTFNAEIVGTDPDTDVAVIKIDAKDLKYLEMADSDELEVGEWVLAIGNPLGLSHTVTAGIVSAKHRSGFNLATIENFIQTDAAINFGNSGGPLINLDGKVVGINTAIVGAAGNIGIGFAIPINMARHVYEQLIKTGKVERGFLGVLPQDMDAEMAKAFGLEGTKGVLIPQVEEGSAADKAGLQHNDVILEVNGEPVESAADLRNRIAMLKPGSKVELTIWRNGKRKKVTAVLGRRQSEQAGGGALSPQTLEQLGFTVRNLTDELARRYGYEGENGVIVDSVEPGSQAARVGIVTGALIKEVNRQPVRNTKEFNEAIRQASKEGTVLLLVKRDWYTFYALLRLSK